jgi:hypothetical protein
LAASQQKQQNRRGAHERDAQHGPTQTVIAKVTRMEIARNDYQGQSRLMQHITLAGSALQAG